MKISLGSDHAGYELKEEIKNHLISKGYEIEDEGAYNTTRVDYPDFAKKVAKDVINKKADCGILFCGTGIGIGIAANKFKGIRCATVYDKFSAKMSKCHNNAQIIAIGARTTPKEKAIEMVDEYINSTFEGNNHKTRVDKIDTIENEVQSVKNDHYRGVKVVNHPLVCHKLSFIRDKNTKPKEFRELVKEISILLAYEATKNLTLKKTTIETPIDKANTEILENSKQAIIPIFRAGLGMVDGFLSLLPSAKVGHIGIYRDELNFKAVEYYHKLPKDIKHMNVYILDPMLATGVSASNAIDVVKQMGASSITFVCLIASKDGIDRLKDNHKDVEILTANIDEKLNDNKYIVPGLGDAGDRLFGTK